MKKWIQEWIPVFWPAALLLLVTLLAFGGSIFHGFAAVDDEFVVVNNLAIRGLSWENIKTVFSTYDPEIYIPITFLSFQLNYLIDGLNPALFHAVNLLLHALNSYLLFLLLQRLNVKRNTALFGALVFAAHPLFTQSVVWITGRKDLLCTLFFLLSFLFYIRHNHPSEAKSLPTHSPQPRGLASCLSFILSLLFFLLSLLSKPTAMTLPVILVLHDVLIAGQPLKKSLNRDKIPYVVLAIIFAVITVLGKERLLTLPLAFDAILLGSKSVVTYLRHFIVPTGFSFFYPFRGDIAANNPALLVPLLFVVALLMGCIMYRKRYPKISFGLLSFLLILSPTFFNLQTGGFTFFAADRFAYLPGIGLIVALVSAVSPPLEAKSLPTRSPPTCLPAGRPRGFASLPRTELALVRGSSLRLSLAPLVLAFLVLTSQVETRYWKNPKQLFARALTLYPESVSARVALANLERQEKKYSRAFEILREGLRYGDDMNLRVAAGIIYANTGHREDAVEQFETARQMAPQNPEPLFSLGAVYEQTGRRGEAFGLFEEAVKLDPSYVAARIHLAQLLRERGELQMAREQLEQALKWNRNSAEAQQILAEIREEQ